MDEPVRVEQSRNRGAAESAGSPSSLNADTSGSLKCTGSPLILAHYRPASYTRPNNETRAAFCDPSPPPGTRTGGSFVAGARLTTAPPAGILKNVTTSGRFAGILSRLRRRARLERNLRWRSAERIFTNIHLRNEWKGRDSVSGTGSDHENTRALIRALPTLLNDLGIETILDIPCGDFHWMKEVPLGRIRYTGADVVPALLTGNSCQFETSDVTFVKLDLLKNSLPRVDLVLCRDCFVHFSFKDVRRAVANICASRSKYLLTTTFIARVENQDMLTGSWRPLNLECAPFRFPRPIRLLDEQCPESEGAFADKCLGLWRIDDLRISFDPR